MATLIFCVAVTVAKTQTSIDTTKAIKIVKSIEAYRSTAGIDSNQRMVSLQQYVSGIVLDLRYASLNNFMKRLMYTEQPNFTFMRLPAAKALALVQKELNSQGFGLKIYDAYRPYFVTVKFWELVHDDRYVADPKKGSGHNRGIAVDLTIINLATKKELDMPTGFDNFTDSAHHDFMALTPEVLRDRALLKETMKKYGFTEFATEWWHYSLPSPEKYDALDLSFGQLKNEAR